MEPAEHRQLPEQPVALWRGFRGACPRCGKGRLFQSYLKQNDRCATCGADFSKIHADDAPGWFVMVITGAILMPAAVFLSVHEVMPDWATMALLIVLALALVFALLPRAKGLFIALLWRLAAQKSLTP